MTTTTAICEIKYKIKMAEYKSPFINGTRYYAGDTYTVNHDLFLVLLNLDAIDTQTDIEMDIYEAEVY